MYIYSYDKILELFPRTINYRKIHLTDGQSLKQHSIVETAGKKEPYSNTSFCCLPIGSHGLLIFRGSATFSSYYTGTYSETWTWAAALSSRGESCVTDTADARSLQDICGKPVYCVRVNSPQVVALWPSFWEKFLLQCVSVNIWVHICIGGAKVGIQKVL